MPRPFAPLLGLLPALLAVPYLILNNVKKRGKELTQIFSTDFTQSVSTPDVSLSESGLFETKIEKQQLESFEFYRKKVPHFKEQQAIFRGAVGEAGYLLFTEESDPRAAEQAAQILLSAGAGHAQLKDSVLKVKIKDPVAFEQIGPANLVSRLRAI